MLPREIQNDMVELIDLPLGQRSVEPGRKRLSDGERHNPFGLAPSADDMLPLRLKLGCFPDPQRRALPPSNRPFAPDEARGFRERKITRSLTEVSVQGAPLSAAESAAQSSPARLAHRRS